MADAFPERVSLNCDMGEGYYRWRLGPDEELFPLIDYANIACGFHAGDQNTMVRMVRLALQHNVGIGAHPGLDDVKGFGRRKLDVSPDDVYALALYQLGALLAIVKAEGGTLSHVKPHGMLYFLLRDSEDLCRAFIKAHVALSPEGKPYPYVGLAGTNHEKVCKDLGVPFVPEVFVDIDYDENKNLLGVPQSNPCTVDGITRKIKSLIGKGSLGDKNGKELRLDETDRHYTICLHSDMPTALENAKAVRKLLGERKK